MAAPDYADEITALEAALASGELTIESEGQRITYRSSTEILDAIAYFRAKAAAAPASGTAGRSSIVEYRGD